MKTLKIWSLLCVMLCFTTNAVNAQAQQDEEISTMTMYIWCAEEEATGEVKETWLTNNNTLIYTFSGTFTGLESGTVYAVLDTRKEKEIYNKSEVYTHEENMLIHANGKLIARLHVINHFTANANGEYSVSFDRAYEECFLE